MTMLLRVSDLKQYCYCPRIVYYSYLVPMEAKTTYKMEHGKVAEAEIAALEKRRKLRAYGLHDGRRRFGVWLNSEEIGLTGKLDMLIETADQVYPVDFKYTDKPVQKNHRFQLCGYALLIEAVYHKLVERGFVYRIPVEQVTVFTLDETVKQECRGIICQIQEMLTTERMPEATHWRNRCVECEYQNYCRDIW